jgi:hypothetical protein
VSFLLLDVCCLSFTLDSLAGKKNSAENVQHCCNCRAKKSAELLCSYRDNINYDVLIFFLSLSPCYFYVTFFRFAAAVTVVNANVVFVVCSRPTSSTFALRLLYIQTYRIIKVYCTFHLRPFFQSLLFLVCNILCIIFGAFLQCVLINDAS